VSNQLQESYIATLEDGSITVQRSAGGPILISLYDKIGSKMTQVEIDNDNAALLAERLDVVAGN
jgi:hypothetical protein